MNEKEMFRKWLCVDIGYQSRTAGNVLSRLNRAHKYVNTKDDNLSEDELIFKLTQNREFKELSASVRSQIKQAVRLYKTFLEQS